MAALRSPITAGPLQKSLLQYAKQKPESIYHVNDVSVYLSLTPRSFCLDTRLCTLGKQRGERTPDRKNMFHTCVLLQTSGRVA